MIFSLASFDFMIIVGPLLIVLANLFVYLLIGKMGRRSKGSGSKYAPFTGGEESIPSRGTYQSELFVFAALFLVVEMFALLISGSYSATSSFYPFLFLAGGGATIVVVILWFLKVGGGVV